MQLQGCLLYRYTACPDNPQAATLIQIPLVPWYKKPNNAAVTYASIEQKQCPLFWSPKRRLPKVHEFVALPVQHIVYRLAGITLGFDQIPLFPFLHDAWGVLLREDPVQRIGLIPQLRTDI